MKRTFWTRTQPLTPDDCGAIDPLLSLYADSMASPEEARRVEAHLPDCADCRASLAWMQATQRALAARPVVSPPVDLRARITDAIAASSAAPVPAPLTARPARVFVLRPAFAAAASLTFLGAVVSYGLLHQSPQVTVPPVKAPVAVADLRPAHPSAPINPPSLSPSIVKRHSVVHLQPARSNPDLVAHVQPDESRPEPAVTKKTPVVASSAKTPADAAPVIAPLRAHLSFVKKPIPSKFKPELMAVNHKPSVAPGERHKAPVLPPENTKPDTVVATTQPITPAPVAVSVGAPSIKPEPAPTVAAASNHEGHVQTADLLNSVKAHIGEMRHVAYATERKSVKGTVLAVSAIDRSKTPGVPIAGGTF